MLSGRSPFLSARPKDDSAFTIMKRIRSGDFRMECNDCPAWKYVSSAARQLVKGLLTVDPKKRMNLDDLFASSWIKAAENRTPIPQGQQLLTPAILKEQPMTSKRNLMQTFNAFHRVTREGGMAHLSSSIHPSRTNFMKLSIPSNRRCKQTKNSASSSASSSGCSSISSMSHSSSLSPTKQHPWFYPTTSVATTVQANNDDHILTFKNSSRIHDYLTSLSQIQQQQQQQSTSYQSTKRVTSIPSSQQQSAVSLIPPLISEALSGISYRLLPFSSTSDQHRTSPVSPPSHSPVSITPMPPLSIPRPLEQTPPPFEYRGAVLSRQVVMGSNNSSGPMTRSRKRKLKDDREEEDVSCSNATAVAALDSAAAVAAPSGGGVSITAILEPVMKKNCQLHGDEDNNNDGLDTTSSSSKDMDHDANRTFMSPSKGVSLIPCDDKNHFRSVTITID